MLKKDDEQLLREKQEAFLIKSNKELAGKVAKLEYANEEYRTGRRAALNLMEDAILSEEALRKSEEEMQYVNSELQTANAQLQLKIRELSNLNDDLNNYFRSNVNGQIFVNQDLVVLRFSPGAATNINLLDSDIGRSLSNITTNIKFETIATDIKEVLAHGNVITKEIQAIDGKWYQIMTMPYLRRENNQKDGAIITFNDISELKQIQEELAKSNKSLKTINADLDNFVYIASHDLLGPINNIDLLIYFIKEQEKNLEDSTKDLINMLSDSTTKFRSVIKELAKTGRTESEMSKLEAIDLKEMIEEILSSIQYKISSVNAYIRTELDIKNITFSRKNCRSMILNLISNALKFSSPDRRPEIVVSTKDSQEHIVLSVKDNGIGISKNKTQSIFAKYQKLNQEAEGQGLGLFLINKIINASGGRVEVESELDEGTEFKLFLKKVSDFS